MVEGIFMWNKRDAPSASDGVQDPLFSCSFSFSEDEDSSVNNCSKRMKLMESNQRVAVPLNLSGESSPLGLTLNKTPSFLNLLEMKLSEGRTASSVQTMANIDSQRAGARYDDLSSQPMSEKLKASNFPASLLKIGSWQRASRYEGDLVAKCYYAKRKLVWEILDSGLKSKIEIQWSDISAIRATFNEDEPGILEIELNHAPLFYRETNPQPRKHTLWQATSDFTGGQAPIYRRHYLKFPNGTLEKHYEKLLHCDNRLHALSQRPFPSQRSPYLYSSYNDYQDYPHELNMNRPEFSPTLHHTIRTSYTSQLPQFGIRKPVVAPQQVRKFDSLLLNAASTNTTSPCSDIESQPIDDYNCTEYAEHPRTLFWEEFSGQENLGAQNLEFHSISSSNQITPVHWEIPSTSLLSAGRPQQLSSNNQALDAIVEHLLTEPLTSISSEENQIMGRMNSMHPLLQISSLADCRYLVNISNEYDEYLGYVSPNSESSAAVVDSKEISQHISLEYLHFLASFEQSKESSSLAEKEFKKGLEEDIIKLMDDSRE